MTGLGGEPLGFELGKVKLEAPTKNLEVFGDLGANPFDSGVGNVELDMGEVKENSTEKVGSLGLLEHENGEAVTVETVSSGGDEICIKKAGDLGVLIGEQLEKVSLDGEVNVLKSSVNGETGSNDVNVIWDTIKFLGENGKKESESSDSESEDESESESSSSGSSSSDSDDDDDGGDDDDDDDGDDDDDDDDEEEVGKKIKSKKCGEEGEIDMEEGEIVLSDGDEMVGWSDDEGGDGGGPIKSKNELKDLPFVPAVTATLEPHHQTSPVGIVLSMMGAQVIVEGVEKHNPLSEGSILWITETRSPLGIVDEIFGPVKNPYYIVRYNSESEVPTTIHQGSPISFVTEFANHVLNDPSLYQKGYDASGANDEELPDELEFSDDEKEAEYKKMLKAKKRGNNNDDSNKPNTKRNENRQFKNQNWNRNTKNQENRSSSSNVGQGNVQSFQNGNMNLKNQIFSSSSSLVQGTSVGQGNVQSFQNEGQNPKNQENHSSSTGLGQGPTVNQGNVQSFPPGPRPAFNGPTGMWNNGLPPQAQGGMGGFPGGIPPNAMPWIQQNPLFQMQMQQGMVPQQQMGNFPPGFPGNNFNPMGGLPSFGGGMPFAGPWPGLMDQNMMLNQMQFAMGLQSQQNQAPMPPLNAGGEQHVAQSNNTEISHNFEQSSANSGESPNFNRGRGGGGRGRRGNFRGRSGRRGGGRGRN